jgi:hypothetical protein
MDGNGKKSWKMCYRESWFSVQGHFEFFTSDIWQFGEICLLVSTGMSGVGWILIKYLTMDDQASLITVILNKVEKT